MFHLVVLKNVCSCLCIDVYYGCVGVVNQNRCVFVQHEYYCFFLQLQVFKIYQCNIFDEIELPLPNKYVDYVVWHFCGTTNLLIWVLIRVLSRGPPLLQTDVSLCSHVALSKSNCANYLRTELPVHITQFVVVGFVVRVQLHMFVVYCCWFSFSVVQLLSWYLKIDFPCCQWMKSIIPFMKRDIS